jgi:hypothetical protein
MKKIPLTKGKHALVDDKDYEYVMRFKWYASKCGNQYYAACKVLLGEIKGKRIRSTILMHRLIMRPKPEQDTHHINKATLDNQRNNLRNCSRSENLASGEMNRHSNQSSHFRGVCWDKEKKLWMAKISHKGKTINLGRYCDEKKAAKAYNSKAKELYGDYAQLNEVA